MWHHRNPFAWTQWSQVWAKQRDRDREREREVSIRLLQFSGEEKGERLLGTVVFCVLAILTGLWFWQTSKLVWFPHCLCFSAESTVKRSWVWTQSSFPTVYTKVHAITFISAISIKNCTPWFQVQKVKRFIPLICWMLSGNASFLFVVLLLFQSVGSFCAYLLSVLGVPRITSGAGVLETPLWMCQET